MGAHGCAWVHGGAWCIGALVHWCIGALVHWCIGWCILVHWRIGIVHVQAHLYLYVYTSCLQADLQHDEAVLARRQLVPLRREGVWRVERKVDPLWGWGWGWDWG